MTDKHEITIRFASEEAMMIFCGWMCDGGGECAFFDASEAQSPEHAVVRMQYRSEDMQYAHDDKRRYGAFMKDRLIVAHSKLDKEN